MRVGGPDDRRRPTDPLTLAASAFVLAMVALAAVMCARSRDTRVPLDALRAD